MECDQKLIRSQESRYELVHQIWVESGQRFVWKAQQLLNQLEARKW